MKDTDKTKTQLIQELNELRTKISEANNTEQKIRYSLQQIEMINANTPNIIWKSEINQKGEFINTYISEVVDEFLSLPKGTINNSWDKFFNYVLPIYLPEINEKFKHAITNLNTIVSFDYIVKKADGTKAWLSSKGRVQIENNKLIAYGSTVNITKRKEIEQELLAINEELTASSDEIRKNNAELILANKKTVESEEKLKTILDNASDTIVIHDLEGKILMANKEIYKRLGYTFDEFMKLTPMDIDNPENAAKVPMQIEKLKKNGFVVFETKHITKTGQEIPTEVNARIVDLAGQKVIISIGRDISKRKQSEIEISQKNDQLELVLKGSNIGWWDWDIPSGDEIYNDILPKLLGYKIDEIEPHIKWWEDKIHPDDLKQVGIDLQEHFENKTKFYKNKHRLKTKTGEWKWFYDHGKVIKQNKDGKPIRMLGTLRNIDKQYRAEQKMLALNEELTATTNALKKNNTELKRKKSEFETLYEEYKTQNEELKKLIERAEKSERQFTALFNQAPLSIQIFDNNGLTLNVNKAWIDIWQSSKDYVIKNVINKYNVLNDTYADKTGWLTHLKKAFKGEIVYLPDLEYDPKQSGNIGRKRILKCIAFPIKRENITEKVVLIHQDVTEIKKYEEELIKTKEKAEESNRLKTEFLNNMSHEIRTPMNGILGFSDLLNEPKLTNEKRKYFVSIIQNSGKQLMKIIDDILEISILETKQINSIDKEVCLNDLLLQLFSIFDIKAKENKTPLYLKKELSDKESTIFIDETKLLKILSNLLENALKFTNQGYIEFGYKIIKNVETHGSASSHGDIETHRRASLHNTSIQIFVTDTGIGIRPEKQKIIFERFSQEEKGISRQFGGLGLGLSIAKENAELLGGNITLISEKGKGSTFLLTIPYKPVNQESKNNELENKTIVQPTQSTILIVEDEEINYLYLETLLENFNKKKSEQTQTANYKIKMLHAKNGQEALNICKKTQDINLILMDLKMPVMNGFVATKLIKEICPNITIIAQTAYSSKEDKEKALQSGCKYFISKPIDKKVFKNIVDKYLQV